MNKMLVALAFFSVFAASAAQDLVWQGPDGGDWGTATNWNPQEVPTNGCLLRFTGMTGYTVDNDLAGLTVGRLRFENTAGTVTVTGNAIKLDKYASNQEHSVSTAAGGSAVINNDIELGAGDQYFYTADLSDVTLNGVVSGTGRIYKTGPIKITNLRDSNYPYGLWLTGSNTYTGGTCIDRGMVVVRSEDACGDRTKEIYIARIPSGSGSAPCTLVICTPTLHNPIRCIEGAASPGWVGNTFIDHQIGTWGTYATDVELTGTVTCPGVLGLNIWKNYSKSGGQATGTLTFNGPVTTQGMKIYSASDVFFRGAVTNSINLIEGGQWSCNTTAHFYSPLNNFCGSPLGSPSRLYYRAYAENAFSNAVLQTGHRISDGQIRDTGCWLNGYSQIIDRVICEVGGTDANKAQIDGGSGNAVLTMRSTANVTSCQAMFKNNLSIVYDPTDDYEFVCSGQRASTAAGSLTVKGGTFRTTGVHTFKNITSVTVENNATLQISNSVEQAFSGVTTATVKDGGVLAIEVCAGTPFASASTMIDIESGGKLRLADGTTLTLQTVGYAGEPVKVGTYNSGNCNWVEGAGSVVILDPSLNLAPTWTGGAGGDTAAATAANWDNDKTPQYLADGLLSPTFASGGGRADFAADANFVGMTFNVSHTNSFTVGGGEDVSIGLASAGFTVPVRDTDGTFTFEVPIRPTANQIWDFGDKNTIKLMEGLVANSEGPVNVTKTGTGALELYGDGTSDFCGDFIASRNTWFFGQDPCGVMAPGAGGVRVTDGGAPVATFVGATFTKPVYLSSGAAGTPRVRFAQDTTTVFKNVFTNMDSRVGTVYIAGMPQSQPARVVCEGGGYFSAAIMNTDVRGFELVITNTPIHYQNEGSEGRYSTVIFAVASNTVPKISHWYGYTYRFTVPYALYQGDTYIYITGSYGGGYIDFCGTEQRLSWVRAGSRETNWITSSGEGYGTAFMTCQTSATNSAPWTGKLNFVKEGGTTTHYRFETNVVNTSTGALVVKAGCVEFADGSSWAGTNVCVDATASAVTLMMEQGSSFAANTVLKLADSDSTKAKISLGGGTFNVFRLNINGVFKSGGRTIGASGSGAQFIDDDHFEGSGVLKVKGPVGCAVILY